MRILDGSKSMSKILALFMSLVSLVLYLPLYSRNAYESLMDMESTANSFSGEPLI
jgi:hypothetical protein